MNTYVKGSVYASFWTQSPPNSIYRTIFEQKMDDMSFDNYKKSIEKAISMPNQAFFGANRQVQEEQESACKVHTYLQLWL